MQDKIYYVEAISLQEKSQEMLKKEYEIHKIKYKEDITYEQFIKFLKDWHDYQYSIDSFISSYHVTLEEAKEYAKNNVGDINEAGCYNYCAVISAPIGISYYNTEQIKEDFIIYKYNNVSKSYEELSSTEKEYNKLIEHVWQMISFH